MVKYFSLLIFFLLANALLPGCKTPKAAATQGTLQQPVSEQVKEEKPTPVAEPPATQPAPLKAADVLPGTWGVGEIVMGDFVQNEMATGTFRFAANNIMITRDPATGEEQSATYSVEGDMLIRYSEKGKEEYRIIHLTQNKIRVMIMNNGIPAYFSMIRLNVD